MQRRSAPTVPSGNAVSEEMADAVFETQEVWGLQEALQQGRSVHGTEPTVLIEGRTIDTGRCLEGPPQERGEMGLPEPAEHVVGKCPHRKLPTGHDERLVGAERLGEVIAPCQHCSAIVSVRRIGGVVGQLIPRLQTLRDLHRDDLGVVDLQDRLESIEHQGQVGQLAPAREHRTRADYLLMVHDRGAQLLDHAVDADGRTRVAD